MFRRRALSSNLRYGKISPDSSEFGIIKGEISRISQVPEKTPDGSVAYNVEVSFPHGLVSTYHKTFPFIQDMDGEAEIITQDQRLIEHFIEPIFSLFRNR